VGWSVPRQSSAKNAVRQCCNSYEGATALLPPGSKTTPLMWPYRRYPTPLFIIRSSSACLTTRLDLQPSPAPGVGPPPAGKAQRLPGSRCRAVVPGADEGLLVRQVETGRARPSRQAHASYGNRPSSRLRQRAQRGQALAHGRRADSCDLQTGTVELVCPLHIEPTAPAAWEGLARPRALPAR
jgi:hypothetical protein